MPLDELWVAFGAGKNIWFFPVHNIFHRIGNQKAKALPAFHAFIGCSQTSFFVGKGKKTAWETWSTFDDVAHAFESIFTMLSSETLQACFPQLERYVVLLYDKTSSDASVNEARKVLFTRKGRSIEAIPPSSAAL